MTDTFMRGAEHATSDQPIVAAELKDKMFTVAQLTERLQATEPLSSRDWDSSERVDFSLTANATAQASAMANPAGLIDGEVRIGPAGAPTYRLTRDALFEATSMIGLPRGYAGRAPSHLIEQQLNWWFNDGNLKKDAKMLFTDTAALAFTRASVTPFSNLQLLDRALAGITGKYGCDPADVMVDYKLTHNLRQTNFRLVVPEVVRHIASKRDTLEKPDNWSTGLQVTNSLVGEKSTSIQGYLFAWWCTNGATSTHATSGAWSRRGSGGSDEEALYDWARHSVDEILGGLEAEFDQIDALKDVVLTGEIQTALHDAFEQYRIPINARERIIAEMTEQDDLTAYGLHAAITAAANDPDLTPEAIGHLLEVGGAYPHAVVARCNACHRIAAH